MKDSLFTETRVAGLFDSQVVVRLGGISHEHVNSLFPAELKIVEKAVYKRRAEFATARFLAREALAGLGIAPVSLHPLEDRSPRWPDGVVGSISHADGMCVVVVTKSIFAKSLGVDVEKNEPMKEDLISMVCTSMEQTWLKKFEVDRRGQLAKLFFCVKEAFYKCQYPITKKLLNFHDIEVEFETDTNHFFVSRSSIGSPLHTSPIDLRGSYFIGAHHMCAGISFPQI